MTLGAVAPSGPGHCTGQTSPGAVPGICSMNAAPTGLVAWRRLFMGMRRPRPENIPMMRSSISSSASSGTPITAAMASRVRSSCVGPRPPQQMTASLRSSASVRHDTMRSRLSPTLVWKNVSMPDSASCSPIHDELVSVICPSRSSVPMATTSVRMAGTLPARRDDVGRRRAWGTVQSRAIVEVAREPAATYCAAEIHATATPAHRNESANQSMSVVNGNTTQPTAPNCRKVLNFAIWEACTARPRRPQ